MADVNSLPEALALLADNTFGDISEGDMRGIITFGARGDAHAPPGTDTIQAAHDALPATGGMISLSQGTYDIATGLTITKPNVVIIGSGPATVLDITGATTGLSVSGSGFRLEKVKVQLNNVAGSLVGVDLTGGSDQRVTDVVFENTQAANTAYLQTEGTETRVVSCRSNVLAGSLADGFSVLLAGTQSVINKVIVNGSQGFNIKGAAGRIDHCKVLGNVGKSIQINAPRCSVIDCEIEAGTRGIEFESLSDNSSALKCTITYPADATNTRGIEIRPGADILTISECILDGVGNTGSSPHGINTLGLATIVRGCQVRNLNFDGILATGDDLIIENNIVDSCRIAIQATGSLRSLFSNNRCTNNSLDGILVKGSSSRCVVADNVCVSNGRDGIEIQVSNENNITGNLCHLNAGKGIEELGADFNNFGQNHARGNTVAEIVIVGASSVGTNNFT